MRKTIVFIVILLATLSPTPVPALLLNLSTRLEIPPPALGEDVTSLIGGFIIGGNSGRKIFMRAVFARGARRSCAASTERNPIPKIRRGFCSSSASW